LFREFLAFLKEGFESSLGVRRFLQQLPALLRSAPAPAESRASVCLPRLATMAMTARSSSASASHPAVAGNAPRKLAWRRRVFLPSCSGSGSPRHSPQERLSPATRDPAAPFCPARPTHDRSPTQACAIGLLSLLVPEALSGRLLGAGSPLCVSGVLGVARRLGPKSSSVSLPGRCSFPCPRALPAPGLPARAALERVPASTAPESLRTPPANLFFATPWPPSRRARSFGNESPSYLCWGPNRMHIHGPKVLLYPMRQRRSPANARAPDLRPKSRSE
jgi:hypothetical protein